jgi:hypothetical protein
MSTPLPWEEQAISDPDALRSFIELCDEVRLDVGSDPCVYHRVTSSNQMAMELGVLLEKHPSKEMWLVGGQEGYEGIHLLAFCGNGAHSESKAYFIQLALQLLPVLLRKRLGWIECMQEIEQSREDQDEEFLADYDLCDLSTDSDYQLRNTES